MDKVETNALIVGGGVVGTAIARAFQQKGIESIVVEKNKYIGDEVSSRNSGVIHAGFYYPQDSIKAQLCNSGNKKIYQYCKENNIFASKYGKLLVSDDFQDINKFKTYIKNAQACGGAPLRIIDQDEIKKIEPNITSKFGLYSPDTGILDVPSFIKSLANDFESMGGLISCNSSHIKTKHKNQKYLSHIITGSDEFSISSNYLIIAKGLSSDDTAAECISCKIKGIKKNNYTKGHYFRLKGQNPFNHLIYPVPNKMGLGIHVSFNIDGTVKFGPDAVPVKSLDYKFEEDSQDIFYKAIKKYYPDILFTDLAEDYVGIRPKIQRSNESFADFSILTEQQHGYKKLIYLQGIESPGLTCSLSLAEHLYKHYIAV